MGAYDPSAWDEFGVALVGAAAALAGLIFVAISINLREILSSPGLPGRAGEAVLTLVLVLVACALLLVPDQGMTALGLEWIVLAAGFWAVLTLLHGRALPLYRRQRGVLIARILTHQTVVLLFVVAGVATATEAVGGLYWVAPASLWAVTVGVSDGWVLLIEILR